jgi:putative transposase
VFQSRFHSQIVEDSLYLLTVCRYVVLNPVRAGLVEAPEDWPWSSCAATAGVADVPVFLSPELIWRHFADGNVQGAVERYRKFIHSVDSATAPPERKPVLGGRVFVAQFEHWRRYASREVPRRERTLRPDLQTLFAGAITRDARNMQAARAYEAGHSMADIARFLELHASTVSVMIRAARSDLGPGA